MSPSMIVVRWRIRPNKGEVYREFFYPLHLANLAEHSYRVKKKRGRYVRRRH